MPRKILSPKCPACGIIGKTEHENDGTYIPDIKHCKTPTCRVDIYFTDMKDGVEG